MPLSEHEQRLLDQMEQALYDDDPKFVSRLAEDPARTHTRKRMIIGGAVVLAGLALIVLGVASQLIWLGGIGFAVMVAGGGYALTPGEKRAGLGTVGDDGTVTFALPWKGQYVAEVKHSDKTPGEAQGQKYGEVSHLITLSFVQAEGMASPALPAAHAH